MTIAVDWDEKNQTKPNQTNKNCCYEVITWKSPTIPTFYPDYFYFFTTSIFFFPTFFIPHHTLVSGYYVIPFGVCPSVRPSVRPSIHAHHFRSITWVFIHRIFSNFAYILLSAMSGMGLLMGKIRPFLTELLPFFVLEKWFLACYSFTVHDTWMKLHRYVAHQRLHIVTKDRHSDLPSLWVICPW